MRMRRRRKVNKQLERKENNTCAFGGFANMNTRAEIYLLFISPRAPRDPIHMQLCAHDFHSFLPFV